MTREQMARMALAMLREAQKLLAEVGAVRTLERLRSTISSAKGAVRAAGYRDYRDAEKEGK
jgi:predicted DNA-binding protein with PD1-like motif